MRGSFLERLRAFCGNHVGLPFNLNTQETFLPVLVSEYYLDLNATSFAAVLRSLFICSN